MPPTPDSPTDGTNTWILREPGASQLIVVDPGPIEDGHLDALTSESGDVGLVLLTHHHSTAPGRGQFAVAPAKGRAVRALDPAHRFGAYLLGDGEAAASTGSPRSGS